MHAEPRSALKDVAVILSLDVARLIRHRRADRSPLWLMVAVSADEVLTQALKESAGRRDSDCILQEAKKTLVSYLGFQGDAAAERRDREPPADIRAA